MEITQLLDTGGREVLREWLMENHEAARDVWVTTSRRRPPRADAIPYVEAVEEALCLGWIDSICKRLPDGRIAQLLSPRRRALMAQGRMTETGLAAMPCQKQIIQ